MKKTVLDIENVKRKIIGDQCRITKMRNEIPDQCRTLMSKNQSNAKAIRKLYDMLFETVVDENTLVAMTNQIEFLKAINRIEQDWVENMRNKDKCLEDLKLFKNWILVPRKKFT